MHDETSGLAVAGETLLRPLPVRPLPPDWLRAWCVIWIFCLLGFVLLNTFALRHYCGHFGRKEGEVPFAPNLWPVSAGRSVMTLWYSDNLKHTAEVGKDCKNLLLLTLYHPCLWGGHFLHGFLHGFDQTRLIKAYTFTTIVLSMTWTLSQAVFFVFTLQQFSCFNEIIPATPMFIVMIVR